jgi:hypothetical protein
MLPVHIVLFLEFISGETFLSEDNIRMDLREIGWDDVYLTHLSKDRDQWRVLCEHSNELSGSIKDEEILY